MCLRFPSLADFTAHSWAQKALDEGKHENSRLRVSGASLSPIFNGNYVYDRPGKRWVHEQSPDLVCAFTAVRGEKSDSNEFFCQWSFQHASDKTVLPYFLRSGSIEPPTGEKEAWNHGSMQYRGEDEKMRVEYISGENGGERLSNAVELRA
ncbi:unnamed protein product [Amoebophrya sp. A120]|nr:unnamed protein product [Amoebophrya sp. A120]|eukprot:GSA120T00016837001.1